MSRNWVWMNYDSTISKLTAISTGGIIVIPNYAGKLVVHVTTSDGGSVGDTRVRVTQAQLGANFIQPLDALDSTTFELLENHVYSVVLIDYPTQYYGGADTVQIAGGTTKEITIELDTEPDIIGIDINESTGEIVYTDGAKNWTPAYYDADHNIHYGSFEDSWLLRGIHSCVVKDGIVQYYLDENDNTKKVDGTPADITSGNDGDVMVEFQKRYVSSYKSYTDGKNQYHVVIQISVAQFNAFKAIGFINNIGQVVDTFYIGKYLGHTVGSSLRSISGATTSSVAYHTLIDETRNNSSKCTLVHIQQKGFISILFAVLFKSIRIKDIYPNYSRTTPSLSGFTNKYPGLFTPNNVSPVKIFGIEGLGNYNEGMEGGYLYEEGTTTLIGVSESISLSKLPVVSISSVINWSLINDNFSYYGVIKFYRGDCFTTFAFMASGDFGSIYGNSPKLLGITSSIPTGSNYVTDGRKYVSCLDGGSGIFQTSFTNTTYLPGSWSDGYIYGRPCYTPQS